MESLFFKGDLVTNGEVQLMIITSSGDELDQQDGRALRRLALSKKIPIITTIAGAKAYSLAIADLIENKVSMKALQDYFTVEGAQQNAAAVN